MRRSGEWLFVPWVAVSAWCVFLMWAWPGGEVVPFHAIWISFALVYGLEAWPLRRTAVTLGVLAVATGAILVHRARTGVIAWEETTEIPLMWTLALLVVWHVQRRQEALNTVRQIARRDVAAAHHRERLARLTSHEMRTPLTIASGYVDLLLDEEPDPARRADLDVVRDELGRLARAGDRLLRMIQLQDPLPRSTVDVDALAADTAQRWAAVAGRAWVVDTHCGTLEASAERLRDCLDTLIENAVRYTPEGGTVRLVGLRRGGSVLLGVADSGPGLRPDLAAVVNGDGDAARRPSDEPAEPDPRSQTGLGIGIVQETVQARRGRLLAGRSREGGALLLMALPVAAPDHDRLPRASGEVDTSPLQTAGPGYAPRASNEAPRSRSRPSAGRSFLPGG